MECVEELLKTACISGAISVSKTHSSVAFQLWEREHRHGLQIFSFLWQDIEPSQILKSSSPHILG